MTRLRFDINPSINICVDVVVDYLLSLSHVLNGLIKSWHVSSDLKKN